MSLETVEVQGDMLEGGGQIVRFSCGLAAVAGKPVRVTNVRAKRSPPGLRPQHLAALKALAEVTSGRVDGLYVGSREVYFHPGRVRAGSYRFDVGTAGSTTLVLQALLPALAYAPGRVSLALIGGTNNPLAPPVEYLEQVLLPALGEMGVAASVRLRRRGFYPRGGGLVEAVVEPLSAVKPAEMVVFTEPRGVSGLAYSSRLPRRIAERMAAAAEEALRRRGYPLDELRLECLQPGDAVCASSPGCGIFLKARVSPSHLWLAGDSLGEPGKPAERVGLEAAEALAGQLAARRPVDRHLVDQLVPWMGLARGLSRLSTPELTLHAVTCIEVSRQVLGAEYRVEGSLGEPAVVECRGVGLTPP